MSPPASWITSQPSAPCPQQTLEGLFHIARWQNNLGRAEALVTECLALHRKLQYPQGIAMALQNLGMLAFLREDYLTSSALYEEYLDQCRTLGDRVNVAYAMANLGRFLRLLGDVKQARSLFVEALPLFTELGDKKGRSYALYGLGLVALERGEHAQAHELFAESFDLSRQVGSLDRLAESMEGLGAVQCATGNTMGGVCLFGTADALRERAGVPLAAADRIHIDRGLAAARTALDRPTFDAAWSMGRVMTPEQAVAEAGTTGTPDTGRPAEFRRSLSEEVTELEQPKPSRT